MEYAAFLAEPHPGRSALPGHAPCCSSSSRMFTLCGMYMRIPAAGRAGRARSLGRRLGAGRGHRASGLGSGRSRIEREPVAVILFGMIVAIAYRQELALLFSGVVSWIVVLALGENLPMFLLLVRHDGRRRVEPGPHPQPQQARLCRPVCRMVAALLDLAMNLIENQPLGWRTTSR